MPILSPFRHKHSVRFLEVGVWYGKSLAMWCDYFTSGSCVIFAVDIHLSRFYEHRPELERMGAFSRNHLSVHQFDTSSDEFSSWTRETLGYVDIVLDDGYHAATSQWQLFTLVFPLVSPGGPYIIEDIAYPADFFCQSFQSTGFVPLIASVANRTYLQSSAVKHAPDTWVEQANRKAKERYRVLESCLKGARHRLNQVGTKESIAKLEEAIRRKEKEISSMSPDGIGSREKYQILAAFAERMQIIEKLSASVESVEVREKNIVFAESRSRLFHQTYNANRFDVSISNKVRKEKVQQLRRQDSLS